ncbi:MAG TPA: cyclopropane-fatty-acyl-phospholipid synthase family protein [Bryobacteraceae bacterium]|nr:cyclopropane-fatty-acyl-phospholipid synthase family protein [Bryobacteraceae bacterium]
MTFSHPKLREQAFSGDLYGTALAYVRGDVDVAGDVVAAVRFFENQARRGWRQARHNLLGRMGRWRLEPWWQSRRRAAENIRHHYDRSNDFYLQFLDRGMTYSCAYFKNPEWDISRAQEAKLDLILRKLDLRPGERFLDIGCGWGSLVEEAARRGAAATGCTLSPAQHEFALERLRTGSAGPTVLRTDYRDLSGQWDKIASIGMFEHVGRRRLPAYFRKVYDLLSPTGLFLNHGIVRPQTAREGVESLFLRRKVFPGSELPHLGELIRASEEAGFEVLDVENLRPHYALTCRAWVERLLRNEEACVRFAGRETHRTWVLYLAACAHQFETGCMDIYQTLLARRSSPHGRRLTREYMYNGVSARAEVSGSEGAPRCADVTQGEPVIPIQEVKKRQRQG